MDVCYKLCDRGLMDNKKNLCGPSCHSDRLRRPYPGASRAPLPALRSLRAAARGGPEHGAGGAGRGGGRAPQLGARRRPAGH